MAPFLKRDELRLYRLIWERFVASQMAAAVYDQTTVDIAAASAKKDAPAYTFRATGSVLKFAGYTKVYEEGKDDEEEMPGGEGAEFLRHDNAPLGVQRFFEGRIEHLRSDPHGATGPLSPGASAGTRKERHPSVMRLTWD